MCVFYWTAASDWLLRALPAWRPRDTGQPPYRPCLIRRYSTHWLCRGQTAVRSPPRTRLAEPAALVRLGLPARTPQPRGPPSHRSTHAVVRFLRTSMDQARPAHALCRTAHSPRGSPPRHHERCCSTNRLLAMLPALTQGSRSAPNRSTEHPAHPCTAGVHRCSEPSRWVRAPFMSANCRLEPLPAPQPDPRERAL